MLLVGLTGGIGSGKSTVSAMLAEHGAVIVDADHDRARAAGARLRRCSARMAERFGQHIIRADGSLDRAAVAAIVFGDDPARAALPTSTASSSGDAGRDRTPDPRPRRDRPGRRARLPAAPRESAAKDWRRRSSSTSTRRSPCTASSSSAAWTSRTPASGSPASVTRGPARARQPMSSTTTAASTSCALRSTRSGRHLLDLRDGVPEPGGRRCHPSEASGRAARSSPSRPTR